MRSFHSKIKSFLWMTLSTNCNFFALWGEGLIPSLSIYFVWYWISVRVPDLKYIPVFAISVQDDSGEYLKFSHTFRHNYAHQLQPNSVCKKDKNTPCKLKEQPTMLSRWSVINANKQTSQIQCIDSSCSYNITNNSSQVQKYKISYRLQFYQIRYLAPHSLKFTSTSFHSAEFPMRKQPSARHSRQSPRLSSSKVQSVVCGQFLNSVNKLVLFYSSDTWTIMDEKKPYSLSQFLSLN
jgi:hypothetical protein